MTDKKWWDTLSDEEKFQTYKNMREVNKSHANALHAVTEHLLGKDRYQNVNYSWSRTWKRITDAIWDHFKG